MAGFERYQRRASEGEAKAAPLTLGLMDQRLGLRLRLAQNEVLREVSRAFAPYDVTPLLYSILTVIGANPGCRPADLGLALAVKRPNLVQPVETLVARGLVSRDPDPADRRANILSLTALGRRTLAELKQIDDQVSQTFIDRLGADDHALLLSLLKRLVSAAPGRGAAGRRP